MIATLVVAMNGPDRMSADGWGRGKGRGRIGRSTLKEQQAQGLASSMTRRRWLPPSASIT